MVGCGAFLWAVECVGELSEELYEGGSHSPVCFEYDWSDGVWVVFVSFV